MTDTTPFTTPLDLRMLLFHRTPVPHCQDQGVQNFPSLLAAARPTARIWCPGTRKPPKTGAKIHAAVPYTTAGVKNPIMNALLKSHESRIPLDAEKTTENCEGVHQQERRPCGGTLGPFGTEDRKSGTAPLPREGAPSLVSSRSRQYKEPPPWKSTSSPSTPTS